MANVNGGDIIRATIKFQGGGSQALQNVYHYEAEAGFDQSPTSVKNGIRNAMIDAYNEINQFMTTKYLGAEIVIQVLVPPATTFTEIASDTFPVNGSGVGEEVVNGAAGLIRFPLEDGGRTGSKFLGGLVDGAVTDQSLGQGFIDQIVLYAVDIVASQVFGTGDLVPGVWSVVNAAFRAMTGDTIINNLVAYQRRRKPGVGE